MSRINTKPVISCLCISNHRPHHLRKAIACFMAQTYPNKELVILSEKPDPEYEALIAPYSTESIKYYNVGGPKLTLGECRNMAIEKSTGDYFCIWDDDDWYHAQRLEIQLEEILRSNKSASVLTFCLLFDSVNKAAHLSLPVLPPQTLMCKKSIVTKDIMYPPWNREEDAYFFYTLVVNNILYPIINPILYIYVFHGGNTWNLEHFALSQGYKMSDEATRIIGDIVEGNYSCEEGSGLLSDPRILGELNYLYDFRLPAMFKDGMPKPEPVNAEESNPDQYFLSF